MRPLRFLLPAGLALALSSCDVFRPDAPQPAANNQGYGAAGAYDANNVGGYPPPAANPYSQPAAGGYAAPNTGGGAYGQSNYNPYTQPADTGAYSNGGTSSTGGNYGAAGGRTHTVASGENLSKIAQRYGVTTDALMRANNITNPNYVRAGQKLTIP
jgi:hypothetical protein